MKAVFIACVLLSATLVGNSAEANVTSPDCPATRECRWHEDLAYLERELPARHLDFFKLIPKRKFEREILRLKKDVPELSDEAVVFRLVRLVASLGVGHTRAGFTIQGSAFHGYPLLFSWFSDGLGVIAASPEYREWIGARVVRIGSMTPKRAMAAVAPYISHENEAWLYEQSSFLFRHSELLRYLGIAQPDGGLHLVLRGANGRSVSLVVRPAEFNGPVKWVSAAEALNTPIRLCHRRNDAYWCELLPETESLYIQYNRCGDVPGRPFVEFAREVFEIADSNTVRRVVVDLRWNGGGDSQVVKPLVSGLKARPHLTGKEHLIALIGHRTFSSGLWAALDLQREAGATLVGQPTGGKPNGYGNSPSMRLPNSQMEVWYCTKNFRVIADADPLSLYPDVRVGVSLRDLHTGRDPALEVALGGRRE